MEKVSGKCDFCDEIIEPGDSVLHFVFCQKRIDLFNKLRQKTENKWMLIRAEQSPYWIDVLVPEKYLLSDVDFFLRGHWLECCGHLSCFRIDGAVYERFQDPDWLTCEETLSPIMEIELGKVLSRGKTFTHDYDYGSTTELELKVLDTFVFSVRKDLYICAQNEKPKWPCDDCNNFASHRCGICQDFACKRCFSVHKCVKAEGSDHVMMPLVNSPRTGVCGYDGTEPGQ